MLLPQHTSVGRALCVAGAIPLFSRGGPLLPFAPTTKKQQPTFVPRFSKSVWPWPPPSPNAQHEVIFSDRMPQPRERGRALLKKSGSVSHKKLTARKRAIRSICAALKRRYGTSRLGNPRDPLDDLIYIILSTRTRHSSFGATYRTLKTTFSSWDKLRPKHRSRLERILAPGGLGGLKAGQILEILSILRKTYGRTTLAPLSKMSDSEAELFLTSLPGVGFKVAKCVMMYTLGRRVLPVDIHVHRIAKRIGFQTKKRPDTSQQLIEELVPPELRYGFHVNAIAHGRAICLSQRPRCELCVISRWCAYYRRRDNRSQ